MFRRVCQRGARILQQFRFALLCWLFGSIIMRADERLRLIRVCNIRSVSWSVRFAAFAKRSRPRSCPGSVLTTRKEAARSKLKKCENDQHHHKHCDNADTVQHTTPSHRFINGVIGTGHRNFTFAKGKSAGVRMRRRQSACRCRFRQAAWPAGQNFGGVVVGT